MSFLILLFWAGGANACWNINPEKDDSILGRLLDAAGWPYYVGQLVATRAIESGPGNS